MNQIHCNFKFVELNVSADKARLRNYLVLSDSWITPPLSSRVNITAFAEKILQYGVVIMAEDASCRDVGIVAFYCNDIVGHRAYITQIAVSPEVRNQGLGKKLLDIAVDYSRRKQMRSIKLEVNRQNTSAKHLYSSFGFKECESAPSPTEASSLFMEYSFLEK